MPNTLLHNGERFIDITESSGTGAFAKGHGIAFADLNNDGDEDIFAVMGGPVVGDPYNTRVFQNPGAHGNDWITLKLNRVKTNRAAIGARIAVTVTPHDLPHCRQRRFLQSVAASIAHWPR
jgi:hypothetical protein